MKRLMIFAMAATVLASCSKDTTVDLLPTEENQIYASIDNEESRVQLQDLHTVWTAGDRIVVHSPSDLTVWQFNGKTGDRKGSFSRVGYYNVDASSMSRFDKYYAVYSYNNYFSFGTVGSTPAILMEAPATQTYLKDSYGLHANTMFGTSNDGVNYTFKNLHGYLRLSLTGDQVVSKIELNGNNSEFIAGVFFFKIDNPEQIYWQQSETSTIIYSFGIGEKEFIVHGIGIKYCLSTDFDTKTGEFRRACFREKKIDFLLEAFPDAQIDDFYTDSMNDKFLFPYAKRVFMVKGNKITRIK